MISIAVERFIVIKHPLKHKIKLSVKHLKLIISVVWLLPILFIFLYVFLHIEPLHTNQEDVLHCMLTLKVTEIGLRVIILGLSNLTIFIMSMKIILLYKKNMRDMARSRNVRNSSYLQRKQTRLTVTLIIVEVVFFITYTPLLIVRIMQFRNLNLTFESLEIGRETADLLAFSSSATNFIIFVARNEAFQKVYCKIFLCKLC